MQFHHLQTFDQPPWLMCYGVLFISSNGLDRSSIPLSAPLPCLWFRGPQLSYFRRWLPECYIIPLQRLPLTQIPFPLKHLTHFIFNPHFLTLSHGLVQRWFWSGSGVRPGKISCSFRQCMFLYLNVATIGCECSPQGRIVARADCGSCFIRGSPLHVHRSTIFSAMHRPLRHTKTMFQRTANLILIKKPRKSCKS